MVYILSGSVALARLASVLVKSTSGSFAAETSRIMDFMKKPQLLVIEIGLLRNDSIILLGPWPPRPKET